MARDIDVEVIQKNIDHAIIARDVMHEYWRASRFCPVAQAIRSATGDDTVAIRATEPEEEATGYVAEFDDGTVYTLPSEVADFVSDFDEFKDVKPFTFTMTKQE